jgi:hypothetical protein
MAVLFLLLPLLGCYGHQKMTFATARDDRIHVSVSILDSLVSMLNEALPRGASKRQIQASGSRFQNALRVHFDSWIKAGKLDPLSDDEYPSFTLRHRVGSDGIAQYFLDFRPPRDRSGPLTPKAEALMWFRLFLTIEGRKLLSQCSKCKRYFLRKRLPKGRQQPTYGDFCPEHRSQLRVRSTKVARERQLNRRIMKAAAFAAKWNERKHMQLRDWVVQQYNLNLGQNQTPMKKWWVTKHMKEIQSEAGKINDPKV